MSTSGGSGGGGGGVKTASVTLGPGDIATLHSVPVEIVPTPGPFRLNAVIMAFAEFAAGINGFAGLFEPVICYGFYDATLQVSVIMGNPLQESSVPPFPAVSIVPGDAQGATGAIRYLTGNAQDTALVVTNIFDVDRAGPIGAISVANGGAGYAPGDTGTIDIDKYNGGATYQVDTVGLGGVVLTAHRVLPGDGYSLVDNPIGTAVGGAQPGVGAGLTVNIDSIGGLDGDLYVTVLYKTITVH